MYLFGVALGVAGDDAEQEEEEEDGAEVERHVDAGGGGFALGRRRPDGVAFCYRRRAPGRFLIDD